LSNTGLTGNSDSWTDPEQSYNIRVEVTAENGSLDSEETFVFVTAFRLVSRKKKSSTLM
jgi:hypothetical protein